MDSPLSPAQTFTDHWFTALDGRVLQVDAEQWRARVLGIHRLEDDVWIQIAAAHDARRTLILHCASTQALEDALRSPRMIGR